MKKDIVGPGTFKYPRGGHMKTAEDIVKDKKADIVSVSYDQSVQQACQLMVDKKIGAILVKKEAAYVGIWTERDLLRNMTAPGFNPETAHDNAAAQRFARHHPSQNRGNVSRIVCPAPAR